MSQKDYREIATAELEFLAGFLMILIDFGFNSELLQPELKAVRAEIARRTPKTSPLN